MTENKRYVILVNPQGEVIGQEEKLKAHQDGVLHKAFSIFIINSAGQMLLQQRALHKYHFAGLWSNACCSHPAPEENLEQAAHRRLQEELGFDTALTQAFSFIYKEYDEKSGLTEHELDFVFTGVYDGIIAPNPQEVQSYRWVSLEELNKEITATPQLFSAWFKQGITLLRNKAILPQVS